MRDNPMVGQMGLVLLAAVLVSLRASFMAYQLTTEQASTHTVARLVIHRVQALVRNGREFGPMPSDVRERFIASDEIQFLDDDDRVIEIRLDRVNSLLTFSVDNGTAFPFLGGVSGPTTEEGEAVGAFLLEYENAHFDARPSISPSSPMTTSMSNSKVITCNHFDLSAARCLAVSRGNA